MSQIETAAHEAILPVGAGRPAGAFQWDAQTSYTDLVRVEAYRKRNGRPEKWSARTVKAYRAMS